MLTVDTETDIAYFLAIRGIEHLDKFFDLFVIKIAFIKQHIYDSNKIWIFVILSFSTTFW